MLVSGVTTDSYLKDITVRDCQVNFFLFKGYLAQTVMPTDKWYLNLTNIKIYNNLIAKRNSFIQFSSFVNPDSST